MSIIIKINVLDKYVAENLLIDEKQLA